ncbi:DNA invertase Pin-like site-specific DNA recombinase [Brevundimonas bullata]|uniref:DNA invertase Pin-like site-specific DNA recombinase n=1 Tax=Brevundimonas bullata TaxID=13160 RepID=A0A7W7IQH1_9CAUL|nr:recombinase family protein [Brevundimonas bullata]MBB4798611.1 DNA invertase Pin-like site-specific DNA recombinase [Brevundimonas bullata]MBB6383074.1 DNA invertase Pin-like site-specific DNA recombinase [Brevundimonas bullata]
MAVVGYARVSSMGQSLEVQEEALKAAGCEKVFAEKRTGTTQEGREELRRALEYVREGDTFVVSRIDRLARSVSDLGEIVAVLTAKGVSFRALQQGEFDTSAATGRFFLQLLGAFAEFETCLRRERQMEGIEKAKAEGRYKGRPKSVDTATIRRLHAEGEKPAHIAKRLGVARSTVYEALKA